MDKLESFLSELLDLSPNADIGLLENAYKTAERLHEGQLRKSGEPYIIHPANVALILAGLGMDDRALAAALLHDTVEDTPYSTEQLGKDFGQEIAFLVGGVTKLGSLVYESKEERQAENLRKMFLAISKDVRVLIIKLADRLHNLRTINYMSAAQIREKCKETLEIYAPLASRLGMYQIKFELEDIALKHLDPEAYETLAKKMGERKAERDAKVAKIIEKIEAELSKHGIEYEIKGRSKHFYSIYAKMKAQNKPFEEIFDLTAVRIIVETVKDCYAVLGFAHTLWRPAAGRFKDYIATPKPNMYQSLHTTLVGDDGKPFEIQIRTRAMHQVAEYGVAAHWKYKEGVSADREELKLAWIRQSLEFSQESEDPREFMEMMRADLFSDQVFVFTPKGDVVELPAGSTPIDFAFHIHTDVGARCTGARIDGKMVPINYALQNGEVVDVVTSNASKGPSRDWLAIAKSAHARQKIRQYLKKQERTLTPEKGRDALERAAKRKGYDAADIVRTQWVAKAAKEFGYSGVPELYAAISNGGAAMNRVVAKLADYYQEEYDQKVKTEAVLSPVGGSGAAAGAGAGGLLAGAGKTKKTRSRSAARAGADASDSRVVVAGMDGMMTRLARCCSPVPGDEIIGFITKGRGVSVHRTDCPNMRQAALGEEERFIPVAWGATSGTGVYDADFSIEADDRKGLFADISRVCTDLDVNISGVHMSTDDDGAVSIDMTLSVRSADEMQKALRALAQVESVREVYRARG